MDERPMNSSEPKTILFTTGPMLQISRPHRGCVTSRRHAGPTYATMELLWAGVRNAAP
jgi:hypothetical protein